MDRSYKHTWFSLLFNLLFSGYHILFGVIEHSWWLFTVGIYSAVLSAVRSAVILINQDGRSVTKFTGIMLMVLSAPLAGIAVLAVVEDRGTVFHEIAMITIAVYAFSKITLAVIKLIRSRQSDSAKESALRNISLAAACVSIFSLQRSMLVSFGGMTAENIRLMNGATGIGVCVIVFWLGLHLVRKQSPTYTK